MTKAPTLPPSYVDVPVTPHEAQQGRVSVEQNGNRLQGGLLVLIVLNVLYLLLTVLGGAWLLRSLPDLLQSWGMPVTPAEIRQGMQEIPEWSWWAVTGLVVLATGINVWCFQVIRQALGALQRWTLEPRTENADALVRQARTVRPWITLGQWFPIVMAVLFVVLPMILLAIAGFDDLNSVGGMDEGIGTMFSLVSMLPSLLPQLIYAVLTWLLLAAVKRWLDAVVTRTGLPSFPVRPFARSLDAWLVFLLVMVILGLLNMLLVTVGMFFFPSVITWLANADETLKSSDREVFGLIGRMLRGTAVFGLLGAVVYVLLAFMTAWARAFVTGVGRVLDADRPAQPQQAASPQVLSGNDDW